MTDTSGTLGKRRVTRGRLPLSTFLIVGDGQGLAGILLVALPVVLAASLGFVSYKSYGFDAAMSIAVGAAGFVAMSEALILAVRPRRLEPLFGGLDRMYRAHKWLGISAFLLMILHDLIEPDFGRAVRETSLGETASDAGELAFNALLALPAQAGCVR